MKFETWLDNYYPYRNRNYRNERLYGKSKFDETYLYHELLEIFTNKIMTPIHYDSGQEYDLIDVALNYNLNFFRFNVLKYICRAGKKQNELHDLEKAVDYLQREIKNIRKQQNLENERK
jgi:hypothetical protein